MNLPLNKPIVFFDGHCNLCNGFVDFLMNLDRKKKLFVASLQGETALTVFKKPLVGDPDSIIFYLNGKHFERSTAVILLLAELGGAWKLVKLFLVIPTFIRDAAYKFIARNRYKFFGKKDTCRLPTPEEKAQFLP